MKRADLFALFGRVFLFLGFTIVSALSQGVAERPDILWTREGEVKALARLPDGRVVVGGDFTRVQGLLRNNLACLNSDGSLDTSWRADVDGEVRTLAVHQGYVYVGGDFSEIAGVARSCLARLDSAGHVDPSWNPNPRTDDDDNWYGTSINAMVMEGTHGYFGGMFENMGGVAVTNLARISLADTGMVDSVWRPNPVDSTYGYASISALALGAGSLFVAGDFDHIGGHFQAVVAKVSLEGTGMTDPFWCPSIRVKTCCCMTDGDVNALAVDNGMLYVGGYFSSVNAQPRTHLARLATGDHGAVLDDSFAPKLDDSVSCLLVDATGIYAGGSSDRWTASGACLGQLVRFDAWGNKDASWQASLAHGFIRDGYSSSGQVEALLMGQDHLFAGGLFTEASSQPAQGVACLELTAGQLLGRCAFVQKEGSVMVLAAQPDGRVIVGGDFLMADSQGRRGLARINADGTLDATWNPDANGLVNVLAMTDAHVYAAGYFCKVGSQCHAYVARIQLAGVGEAERTWVPDIMENDSYSWTPPIRAIAVTPQGVVLGGDFICFTGEAFAQCMVKLSADDAGIPDPNWLPTPNGIVNALAFQGDNLFVGGEDFSIIEGLARSNLAKVSLVGSGTVDADWNPSPDGAVYALITQENQLIVAGEFENIGGASRLGLAKITGTGKGLCESVWDPCSLGFYVGYKSDTYLVHKGVLYAASYGSLSQISLVDKGETISEWYDFAEGSIEALAATSAGVWLGGDFTSIAGQSIQALALFSDAPSTPSFLNQPSNKTVLVGEEAGFQVTALGASPLYYQWFKDGHLLAGQTNGDCYLLNVSDKDAGVYYCMVSNSLGTATSSNATLKVEEAAPTFYYQGEPYAETLWGGQWVYSYAYIRGSQPMLVQWFKDGKPLEGQTNDCLYFQTTGPIETGTYTLMASNRLGVILSTNLFLSVLPLIPLSEALDNQGLVWSYDSDSPWFGQTNIVQSNGSAATCMLDYDLSSTLKTVVTGPGTLSFWWKLEVDEYTDASLGFQIGTNVVCTLQTNQEWQYISCPIPAGLHTLAWDLAYEAWDYCAAQAWLDGVRYESDAPPVLSFERSSASGTNRCYGVLLSHCPSQASVVVERSFNLTDWVPVSTNTVPGRILQIDPIHTNAPIQFLRAIIQP